MTDLNAFDNEPTRDSHERSCDREETTSEILGETLDLIAEETAHITPSYLENRFHQIITAAEAARTSGAQPDDEDECGENEPPRARPSFEGLVYPGGLRLGGHDDFHGRTGSDLSGMVWLPRDNMRHYFAWQEAVAAAQREADEIIAAAESKAADIMTRAQQVLADAERRAADVEDAALARYSETVATAEERAERILDEARSSVRGNTDNDFHFGVVLVKPFFWRAGTEHHQTGSGKSDVSARPWAKALRMLKRWPQPPEHIPAFAETDDAADVEERLAMCLAWLESTSPEEPPGESAAALERVQEACSPAFEGRLVRSLAWLESALAEVPPGESAAALGRVPEAPLSLPIPIPVRYRDAADSTMLVSKAGPGELLEYADHFRVRLLDVEHELVRQHFGFPVRPYPERAPRPATLAGSDEEEASASTSA